MPVPAYHCAILKPGDRLWAILLPGHDPVCVTVEAVEMLGQYPYDDPDGAQLAVRTAMGTTVWIMHTDIVRRATDIH